jgi:hypothetical protein
LIWLGFVGFDVDVIVPLPLPAFVAPSPAVGTVTVKLVPLIAVP